MADRRDNCRRFHGNLYCEVDRFNRFDCDVSYSPYYYVPFYYPYYGCGYGWDGPVDWYDCFD